MKNFQGVNYWLKYWKNKDTSSDMINTLFPSNDPNH